MFSGCSAKFIENFQEFDNNEVHSQDQKEEIQLPSDVEDEEKTFLKKNNSRSKNKTNARKKAANDKSHGIDRIGSADRHLRESEALAADHGTDEDIEENAWELSENIEKGQEISTKARKHLNVPKEMEDSKVVAFEDVQDSEKIEEGFSGSSITGAYMLKIFLLSLLITAFIWLYCTKEVSGIIHMVSSKIKALPHDVIHYGVIFLVIWLTLLIFD